MRQPVVHVRSFEHWVDIEGGTRVTHGGGWVVTPSKGFERGWTEEG